MLLRRAAGLPDCQPGRPGEFEGQHAGLLLSGSPAQHVHAPAGHLLPCLRCARDHRLPPVHHLQGAGTSQPCDHVKAQPAPCCRLSAGVLTCAWAGWSDLHARMLSSAPLRGVEPLHVALCTAGSRPHSDPPGHDGWSARALVPGGMTARHLSRCRAACWASICEHNARVAHLRKAGDSSQASSCCSLLIPATGPQHPAVRPQPQISSYPSLQLAP